MTLGSNKLYFGYDASGTPLRITYNGTHYYYVTNLQGDVIAILNSSGTAVVQYTYDAWGNILTTTGSMASTLGVHNPLRYRGYVYDQETNLYYLQSRYYNPKTGRFLNADAFTSTGQGLTGNNMFAYCGNNPINNADTTGCAYKHTVVDNTGVPEGSAKKMRRFCIEVHKVRSFVLNDDEQRVLDAQHFAIYKGQLVIKQDWAITNSRSGSFGIMFLHKNETDPNTVKHEWGHYVQLTQMGLGAFLVNVAIPSVMSDGHDPNYYSNPWERMADYLGGVQRESGYQKNSLLWGLSQYYLGGASVPMYYLFGK